MKIKDVIDTLSRCDSAGSFFMSVPLREYKGDEASWACHPTISLRGGMESELPTEAVVEAPLEGDKIVKNIKDAIDTLSRCDPEGSFFMNVPLPDYKESGGGYLVDDPTISTSYSSEGKAIDPDAKFDVVYVEETPLESVTGRAVSANRHHGAD